MQSLSSNNKSENKRIASNTAMLYIRMLLTLGVSLYTSRIILITLGVKDFGIYNVVGGFVTMTGILNNAMATSTQRFLSYEIGRRNFKQLANVFSMSITIHFIIAIFILLIAESFGLWFINTQLIIPHDRMEAAKWVYQFAVLALIVNVISVPYNAAIIAHERMKAFAWVSLIDVSLKLIIVFILDLFDYDKLKFYALLSFIVAISIRFLYSIYCRSNFTETKYRFFWDTKLFKTLISYASWNLWGNTAQAFYGQGINVLLNIFFGPIANASAGIAYQVRSGINGFVQNFQMAINPPIIKSYASNNLQYMHALIFQGAKYSFFLLFAMSLPILLETEYILKLWLKVVPEYATIFTQLTIIMALINSISGPLMSAAQASGKIRLYQGSVGGLLLLILPVSYLFFKFGFKPHSTFIISIVVYLLALALRLIIVSKLIEMSVLTYLKEVVSKVILVSIVSVIIPISFKHFFPNDEANLVIMICGIAVISVLTSIYFIGLKINEQEFINSKLLQIFNKIRNS